jgi:pyruvate-ferredoxin/flavodoxin oxidoreductase
MAELAAASGAPATPMEKTIPVSIESAVQTAGQTPSLQHAAPGDGPLVEITEEDLPKCTNCKTCYQDVAELFERTKIVVDGATKEVSRVIPGIFDKIEITDELVQRASRVADDCDAEIIRFHPPA